MKLTARDFRNKAEELFPKLQELRRHLHQYPELSFQEKETAAYIGVQLQKTGIDFKAGVAGTGLVGTITGNPGTNRSIALRADIDALPIQETPGRSYGSKNEGVMHACGHDVHTTSLLGASMILHSIRDHFSGSVRLLFQPGEEKLPGGASLMIKEGVLENPAPAAVLGQHVMPLLDCGKVGFRSGRYMASTDELYFIVKGKGGHGAMPHLGIDPVVISSHLILALQQIVSRKVNPVVPSVLSIGKVIAQGATNVIPDEVYMEGTFRTLDENWRNEAHHQIRELSEHLVRSMGGSLELEIRKGYPTLYNDEALTQKVKKYATEYMGEENVTELDIWMAAEDFAFYSQVAPSCFYRLGTRNEKLGITSSVHTSTFDIDEQALIDGAGLMAWLAYAELTGEY